MNVLHVTEAFSPLSQTFVYDYVTGLERQGIDGHVVTFRRERKEERPFPSVTVLSRPGRWHPRRLWHRALAAIGIGEARAAGWPELRARLERVVRRVQPDLMHAHFGLEGVWAAPVARACGVPLVVSFHGFDAFRLPNEDFWAHKFPGVFATAARLTAVSHVMANHLVELGAPAGAVDVVRVGKRLDAYPYRDPSPPVRDWVSVGRLVEKKGFEDSIAAFGRLVDTVPDATLTIIGDGHREGPLRRQIESAGLSERVSLLGPRPHDEVKDCLRAADAFVLASKTAANGDREGVPTVLMEAQATGCPVVTTRHSGIPEAIPESDHDAVLAPEGDVAALARRMHALTQCSGEELKARAERGRAHVKRVFRLEKALMALRATYDAALADT